MASSISGIMLSLRECAQTAMLNLLLIVSANFFSRLLIVWLACVAAQRVFARCGDVVTAFAAGLLITISCTHLIPETLHAGLDPHIVGAVLLVGFLVFMVIECALSCWDGHIHGHVKVRKVPALLGGGDGCCGGVDTARAVTLLTGAACHSFVDGVLVASAFALDITSGLSVKAAAFAHELPQVLGQSVILMQAGFDRKRATYWIFAASMISVAGGTSGWALLSCLNWFISYAMLVSAASFIFVALGLLLPEFAHGINRRAKRFPAKELVALAAGVVLSLFILSPLHNEVHGFAAGEAQIHRQESVSHTGIESEPELTHERKR